MEQQNGDNLLVIAIKNLLHWLAAFCAEIELPPPDFSDLKTYIIFVQILRLNVTYLIYAV